MEWTSPLSRHVGPGGLTVVRLALVEEDGDRHLLLRRWLYHPDVLEGGLEYPAWEPLGEMASILEFTPDDEQTSGVYGEHVLLEGVEQFELGYFGELQPGDGAEWHAEWNHRSQLPELVRLRLQRAPEEWWPELVVRLPMGTGSGR